MPTSYEDPMLVPAVFKFLPEAATQEGWSPNELRISCKNNELITVL